MSLRLILILMLLFAFCDVLGQQETYFYKIQKIATGEYIESELDKKIDSLKRTRRQGDSHIKVLFNRDVDFGYKHKRIQVVLNSVQYQVNLLLKNDTICLSSAIFCDSFGGADKYYMYFNNRHSVPYINSFKASNYIKLRNAFYHSNKTFAGLKKEFDLNEWYALNNGDGYTETLDKKHIDSLVKRKDFKELETMLKSTNCEIRTYGVRGFDLLKKHNVKISLDDQKIIKHIKKRNSELESCSGDICPIIWKAYK